MAYLSRCQFAKKIPSLSSILGSTRVVTRAPVPATIRAYTSQSLVKNASSLQRPTKLPAALPVFANQARASSTGGDHVRLWQFERIVSASFVILLPACILLQNVIVDSVFSLLVVMHAHWGLEALILDYARPEVVGKILPKALHGLLFALSAVTLAGLVAIAFSGPGVGGSIRKMWAIGRKE